MTIIIEGNPPIISTGEQAPDPQPEKEATPDE